MIPVVYIHLGELPDYLFSSMKQAIALGNKVVLISDNSVQLDGIDYESYQNYLAETDRFEQLYEHMSTNSSAFEKICIKRWIILANYVAAKNLNHCYYSDSDVMLYCKVDDYPEYYAAYDATYTLPEYQENYRWTASACCSYWKLATLQAFKKFILDIYLPENKSALQEKWNYHQQNKIAGGVCDMTLLYLFHQKINFLSLSKVNQNKAFDQNHLDGENYFKQEYEMIFDAKIGKSVKKIFWENNLPYAYNLRLKQKIKFLALTEYARYVDGGKGPDLKTKIYRFVKRVEGFLHRKFSPKPENPGWFGNYSSWEAAEKDCAGYAKENILLKVKSAVLQVKNGAVAYERDSVTFDSIQYSEPLIASFKESISKDQLHVLDFGGSLGSSYFQHRNLFQSLGDFKWAVVEQKHFVDLGKAEIAEGNLKFYYELDEALQEQKNQVLLLSSVLPYLPDPYQWINKFIAKKFDFIIIDRTAFLEAEKDRITKQVVPESIYKASYPAWFFNEQKFLAAFTKDYELIRDFKSAFDPDGELEDGVKVYRKGFYFKRRK